MQDSSAIWFSPDGNHLAYASFDDRNVQEILYLHYGEPGNLDDQYPTEVKIKYPKVRVDLCYSTTLFNSWYSLLTEIFRLTDKRNVDLPCTFIVFSTFLNLKFINNNFPESIETFDGNGDIRTNNECIETRKDARMLQKATRR